MVDKAKKADDTTKKKTPDKTSGEAKQKADSKGSSSAEPSSGQTIPRQPKAQKGSADSSTNAQKPNGQSSAQPQGMGLSARSKKGADGAKKTAAGAAKTAEGATQATAGASRVAAGDLTGVADTVKGAKKTLDGAKDMKQGLGETKDAAKNKTDDSADQTTRADGKNADGTDPNFQHLDQGLDAKLMDNVLGKGKDKAKTGMKGLMSDDAGDTESADLAQDKKSKGGDSDKDDGNTFKDIKNVIKKGTQGAAAGSGAYMFMGAMKMLQWLKMLLAKGLMMLSNAWAAVLGFITNAASWLASVTGLSALVSMIATVGSAITAVTTVIVSVVVLVSSTAIKDDALNCVPDTTSVGNSVLEWQQSGESSALRTANVEKAWSLFSEMGVNEIAAAGILGNFDYESGLDSTGVETVYDEPYAIGPKKAAAEAVGFQMSQIDPGYAAKFPGVKLGGIGLGQWSNGRNTTLTTYATSHGLAWHDIGTQLAFMFDGDNKADIDLLWEIVNDPNLTINSATERFMGEWERPASMSSLSGRQQSAAKLFLSLKTTTIDTDYAQSIISGMNTDVANANNNKAAYGKDDGCGDTVGSHQGGQADGTGVFPASATGTMWSPATLPSELAAFTHNPEDAGLSYGSETGWNVNNGNPGQCVAFSDAYMQALYGVDRPGGVDGGGVAGAWAAKYGPSLGGAISQVPAAGAVFSYDNTGVYGHTGIVDHVFANGDILVVEQNINGFSGDNNGTPSTWSWRYFTKDIYEGKNGAATSRNWKFYKPTAEPKWAAE